MLKTQFSPRVADIGKDTEKITAIYCLWMVDNEGGESGSEKKTKVIFSIKSQHNNWPVFT